MFKLFKNEINFQNTNNIYNTLPLIIYIVDIVIVIWTSLLVTFNQNNCSKLLLSIGIKITMVCGK